MCQEKDNEQDTPRDDQVFQELGLLHAFLPLIYTLSTGLHKMIPSGSAARKGEHPSNKVPAALENKLFPKVKVAYVVKKTLKHISPVLIQSLFFNSISVLPDTYTIPLGITLDIVI